MPDHYQVAREALQAIIAKHEGVEFEHVRKGMIWECDYCDRPWPCFDHTHANAALVALEAAEAALAERDAGSRLPPTPEQQAEIAACPTPVYHTTHRYCPSCPWTETPRHLRVYAPDTNGGHGPDQWTPEPPPPAGYLCRECGEVWATAEECLDCMHGERPEGEAT